MPSIRLSLRLLLATSIFCFIASVARAQVPDPVAAAQVPIPGAGHHYIGIGAETVNPADGSLSFDLPLQPPAGRQLSFPFGIHYNASERFSPSGTGPGVNWVLFPAPPFQLNGWNYQLPVYTAQVYQNPYGLNPQQQTTYCDHTQNYIFRGFDGIQRNIALQANWPDNGNSQFNCNPTTSMVSNNVYGFSSGAPGNLPGWPVHPSITVSDASGTNYFFPSVLLTPSGTPTPWGLFAQTITDKNGNQITFTGASNSGTSGSYKDTVGRTVVSWSGIGSSSGDQLSIAGLGGNIVVHWTTTQESFPESGHDVSDNGVAGPCSMTPNHTSPQSIAAVSEIDIPGNPTQQYKFSYDSTSSYGRPWKITFPGNGYVRYVWGLNTSSAVSIETWPVSAGANAVCDLVYDTVVITDRYVSYNGSSEVLHQHFDYTTTWGLYNNPAAWSSKTTKVTSTDLLTGQTTITNYTYVGGSMAGGGNDASPLGSSIPLEQQITYQDGSGHTLKTVNKNWLSPFHMLGEQTILDNGQGKATLRCYVAYQISDIYEYGFQGEGAAPSLPSCANPPPYGSPLNGSAIGPLRRHTGIVYHAFSNTNILNEPDSVTVYDGSGNQIKQSAFGYDASSLLPSGAANLVAPPGLRGNLTSATRWLNTGTSPKTTYNYYDTGQVQSTTDPCGNTTCSDMTGTSHTTSYSYTDSYASCGGAAPPVGGTNAYLTQITDPLGHTQSFCYGYNDGQLRGSTDPNGQLTQYNYNDVLARLKETDYPDGGKTYLSYNDSPYNSSTPSPSVTTTKLVNSTTNLVSTSAMDGLGHTVQTKISDPNCSTGDTTNTTYDGFGRVYTVSNPFCSAGDLTYGLTQHTYDALGRTSGVTHPDGSIVTTTYFGRATQVQDEGNGTQSVTRISQVDGLGHLMSVCEVSSTSLPGVGGPRACGQDISNATGYPTTYLYDPLDNLLQVNQENISPRAFVYDSLSRLISASNPESGTTCYGTSLNGVCQGGGYDANGNVSTKTDARNVITTFGYDPTNRLLSKTYTDYTTPTPGVTNIYDTASVDGLTVTNPVGRLVKTSTSDGLTATVNSYDQVGRIKNQWQCTPQNCGSGYFSLPYLYDFMGNITSAGNGMGVTIGYGPFNGAGELTNVTSTLSDANHPATLFSNPTYTPFGSISTVQLGNGITEKRAYNTRLALTSYTATDPTGGSATQGSGTVTVSGSEQYKQVQTQAAAPGQGSVTIYDLGGNVDQSTQVCSRWLAGGDCQSYRTVWDSGTVSITINGVTSSVGYNSSSNDQGLATGLASAINGNPSINGLVSASPLGTVVKITAKGTGPQTNYSLSATSATSQGKYFSDPSFSPGASGSSLTGGQNAAYSTTYDSGTVSITINPNGNPSYTATANYQQGDNAMSVANGLVSALGPSPVHGWTNGCVASSTTCMITLVANASGSATNYAILTPYGSSNGFSPSSFSASGSNMSGGTDDTLYSLALTSYAPNGDVLASNDSVNGNWTYNYDEFNRVLGANQNSGQSVYSYVYDINGNRWRQNGPNTMVLSFTGMNGTTSINNNQADGYYYDFAGNTTWDGTNSYTYDAENRMVAVNGSSASYIYDANGHRVRKTVSGASVDFLYDLAGREITEVSSAGVWNRGEVYAGSRHLATYNNGSGTTYFNHSDWLGTERVRSSVSGVIYETCTSLVFGDWLTCSGSDSSPMHFTGKEHDSESGLDYFGARYTGPRWGRFLSPDWSSVPIGVPYADLTNPQSLNLYAYVKNNPLLYTDVDGHEQMIYQGGSDLSPLDPRVKEPPLSRVEKAVLGLGQVVLGLYTLATTGDVPAAEALVISGTGGGLIAHGTADVAGAIDNASAEKMSDVHEGISAATSAVGITVTVATKGDASAGAAAATVTDVASAARHPSQLLDSPGDAVSTAQSAKDAPGAITRLLNFFRSPTPPPPTPPPPPTCAADQKKPCK